MEPLRHTRIQPFLRPDDAVLEYGARSEETLLGLRVAQRYAYYRERISTPSKSAVIPVSDLHSLKNLDAVICDHVLEYLDDPAEILVTLKAVLKPGGRLLVFALYDKTFSNPQLANEGTHLYSWNVQTLGNLLVDCGYAFESGSVANEELRVVARRS